MCRNNLRHDALQIVYDRLHRDELKKILNERLRPIPDQLPDDAICDYHEDTGTGRDWHGPCKVIRQNKKMTYLQKPGGEIITCHRARVRPRLHDGKIEIEVIPVTKEVVDEVEKEIPEIEEADYRSTYKRESETAFQHKETDIEEYIPYNPNKGFEGEDEEVVDLKERCKSIDRTSADTCVSDVPEPVKEKRGRGRPRKDGVSKAKSKSEPKKRGRGRPKKGENPSSVTDLKSMTEILEKHFNKEKTVPVRTSKHELSRILKDARKDDLQSVGKGVLTRAQKKKLMNLFVVDYTTSDASHDVFVTKDDLKLKECVDGPEFNQPKLDEWAAWQRNDSFEWVKDEGQPRVRCRWVLTKRRVFTKQQLVKLLRKELDIDDVPLVIKIKARLTPQGTVNQDPDRQNIECESPTANKVRIRCLLSFAAINDWDIETFDVSEAFLQKLPIKDLEGILKR